MGEVDFEMATREFKSEVLAYEGPSAETIAWLLLLVVLLVILLACCAAWGRRRSAGGGSHPKDPLATSASMEDAAAAAPGSGRGDAPPRGCADEDRESILPVLLPKSRSSPALLGQLPHFASFSPVAPKRGGRRAATHLTELPWAPRRVGSGALYAQRSSCSTTASGDIDQEGVHVVRRATSLPTSSRCAEDFKLRTAVSDYSNQNVFAATGERLCLARLKFGVRSRSRNSAADRGSAEQLDRIGEGGSEPNLNDGKMTRTEAIVSVTNLLVGTGMLSLPYSFSVAGWAAGGMLVVCTAILAFTGVLIGKALDLTCKQLDDSGVEQSSRDFATLAYLAGGTRARNLIGVVFALELWMASVSYLVLIGINAHSATGLSPAYAIIGAGIVAFGLFYVSMKVVAYISLISVFAIGSAAMVLFWSGYMLPSDGPDFDSYHDVLKPSGLTTAFGLILYSFGGHPCLPNIYWNMKDKRQFRSACVSGCAAAMCFYATVGLIGYFCFGTYLKQSFTENLGRDLHMQPLGSDVDEVLRYVAAIGFVIKLQGTMPLILGPMFTVLEHSIRINPQAFCQDFLLRFLLTTGTVLAALLSHNALEIVISITGCALTMATAVVFPCAVFMGLAPKDEKPPLMQLALIGVGCFGCICGTYGTVDAIRSFVSRT